MATDASRFKYIAATAQPIIFNLGILGVLSKQEKHLIYLGAATYEVFLGVSPSYLF